MKFELVKTDKGIIPATEDDRRKLAKVGQGEVFTCQTIDQRNAKMHRKFFALIKLVFLNMPEKYDKHYPSSEALRSDLIISAGFYNAWIDRFGNACYEAKSIAYDRMGKKNLNSCITLLCRL